MTAIAELLKGTVSESLKKLVQPAGLVPAAAFILLNLGFIYPAAQADGDPIAQSFHDLDATWQAVVVAALIFALGYLLVNSANAIIDWLSGEPWRSSGASWLLRRYQLWRRGRLIKRIANPRSDDNRTALAWRLATEFPTNDNAARYVQPTRLGNVIVARHHVLWQRYGIDPSVVWSQMEVVKDVKDTPALAAVREEKATLDLLANLIFVLSLFAIEGLVYFSLRNRWDDALLSLLALIPAYVAYRVATGTARSWGGAIEAVFDLHRDDLRKALGLRDKSGIDDERSLWRQARRFYLPGHSDVATTGLFEKEAAAEIAVTAAPALKVDKVVADAIDEVTKTKTQVEGGDLVEEPETRMRGLRRISYVLLVSRVGKGERWADGEFVITDPRLKSVAHLPDKVKHGAVQATPVDRSSDVSRLEWRIEGLRSGGSVTLAFSLPMWRLEVDHDLAEVTRVIDRFVFKFAPPAGPEETEIAVRTFAPPVGRPVLRLDGEPVEMDLDHESGRWLANVTVTGGDQRFSIELPK